MANMISLPHHRLQWSHHLKASTLLLGRWAKHNQDPLAPRSLTPEGRSSAALQAAESCTPPYFQSPKAALHPRFSPTQPRTPFSPPWPPVSPEKARLKIHKPLIFSRQGCLSALTPRTAAVKAAFPRPSAPKACLFAQASANQLQAYRISICFRS